MVTNTRSPSSRSITSPRILVTGTALPSSDCAAVAPSATTRSGLISAKFLVEPPAAGLNLAGIRLGVDAALAARLELEVLYRIGDIDLVRSMPASSRIASKTLPAGPTNGLPAMILLIARLLADEHHLGVFRPFAEHGLRRVAPERAAAAVLGRFAQFVDRVGICAVARLGRIGCFGQCFACTFAWCGAGRDAILAIISPAASSAPSIIPGMSEASGRFRETIESCLTPRAGRGGSRVRSRCGRRADIRPA